MKRLVSVLLAVLIAGMFVWSCSDTTSTEPEPQTPAMETETRTGNLDLPVGSTLESSDLEITTFAESKSVNDDGSFSVAAPVADKFQVLFVRSKSTGNPVYFGLYEPMTKSVAAGVLSTAKALLMFNPNLAYSGLSERTEYLNKAQENPKFSELITELEAAYTTDAENALDYEKNIRVYQLAVQIMQETLEELSTKKDKSIGEPPHIEDKDGSEITFVSPRYVWYAAGIYPNGNEFREAITLNRKEKIIDFQWGQNPITEDATTDYDLGDGNFDIFVTKGGDFSKILDRDDPVGRATLANTGQSIIYLIELVVGNLPPSINVLSLANHLHISADQSFALGEAVGEGDAKAFVIELSKLLISQADAIALWIWEGAQHDAAAHFLNIAGNVFKNFAVVLKILGYVNEQGPFFFDLVFAPKEVRYYVSQTNGVLGEPFVNAPPTADFSINPTAGTIETNFEFDASATTDDLDEFSSLKFRWDWEGDGKFDTQWSSDFTASHKYSESGSYSVVLEVMDSYQSIGTLIRTLNVGGGEGSANRVKLFMDNLPWDSNAMIDMLQSLGFTEGVGENTYQIITSDQFSTVQLTPGEDLIIISNDQNQTFYDNYAKNQAKFGNFVYNGGSLFWGACDEGWADGSFYDAGLNLPGNITTNLYFSLNNFVFDQNLPLVTGLPDTMYNTYASHESFGNLPDGTIVYTIDEESNPTLIEFNFGDGWIIVTGQPLEFHITHGSEYPGMLELLPRITSHFTGKQITKEFVSKSVSGIDRLSSSSKKNNTNNNLGGIK